MPNHGVDIIDGIPVILKNGTMYAFQPDIPNSQIVLGQYNSATKQATWCQSHAILEWMSSYRDSISPRSRKL